MILDDIISHKKLEVAERKLKVPLTELKAQVDSAGPPRNFASAMKRTRTSPAVIAEVKKASPSKGIIREDFDPVAIAQAYERGGASAISVLTDRKFFQGSRDYLSSVRGSVSIPVLCKDFIIDPYQIYEARSAGADAVLLIVAALPEEDLKSLFTLSRELEMECLVESHSKQEIEKAVRIGASLFGINNRDLHTFTVDTSTTLKLMPFIPSNSVVVSESGIFTREDLRYLGEHNVDAVLIGEALMRASDPESALRELLK